MSLALSLNLSLSHTHTPSPSLSLYLSLSRFLSLSHTHTNTHTLSGGRCGKHSKRSGLGDRAALAEQPLLQLLPSRRDGTLHSSLIKREATGYEAIEREVTGSGAFQRACNLLSLSLTGEAIPLNCTRSRRNSASANTDQGPEKGNLMRTLSLSRSHRATPPPAASVPVRSLLFLPP